MGKSGEFLDAVIQRAGDIAFYPIEHPVRTAKVIAIGGAAIAAPLMTIQFNKALGEHGPRQPASRPDTEQSNEHKETPEI